MKTVLNILIVEDSESDAVLLVEQLQSAGFTLTWKRVETEPDFCAGLSPELDIIFSDFTLPQFSVARALELLHEKKLDVPFIIVSGTIGEERAVESLKAGATDYVLKDRRSRLAPAARRALREAQQRAERKRLEAQFIEAQKMEVVGQLAGGIAHDFNNILGVIIGYSDLMMSELSRGSLPQKCAEEIRQAADRAVALTRQLLLFSRKQTIQTVVLDLNEVVKSFDKMLRRLIHENIEMEIISGKQIGRVKADPGQIGQVLMNLVVNARDAMPNGGKLTIEINNVALSEDYARTHVGAIPGDYAMLAVADTGTGMTEEVKARLFEAFFTTKPKGKGTGLGLATCQTIVRQSNGYIDVFSEPGKGTVFKIYFPQIDQPLDSTPPLVQTETLSRGTETILLVEDDPSVRHLACNVLESLGYNVLRANNGQEGLRVVNSLKGQVLSLVITDVVMPQMDGKVMAEWLKATYPDLKVLFTSGYTDDAIVQHGVLEPGVAFLPKPYTPAVLAGKVRAILDKTDTSVFRKKM